MSNKVAVFWPGDAREIPNQLALPSMQEATTQLVQALKKLGREVEFVRFPNESHGLSRSGQPKHRVERLERLCAWFDARL